MVRNKEIEKEEEGWKKITNLFRATFICTDALSLLGVLNKLDANERVTILCMKPRIDLNNVLAIIDYRGQIIFELLIILKPPKISKLRSCVKFLKEIQNACEEENKLKLMETYNRSELYLINEKRTTDK